MYKTYTKQTYEESLKNKREMLISSSHIIDGYCEMQNGILHFRGDIPGVSYAQARYYLIYMIRDIYGPEVWINPIFFSISKSNKSYKDREIFFNLKPYEDDRKRIFIKFSSYEKEKQSTDKREVGDLMPRSYHVNKLPELNENTDTYSLSYTPKFDLVEEGNIDDIVSSYHSNIFAEPTWSNPNDAAKDFDIDFMLDTNKNLVKDNTNFEINFDDFEFDGFEIDYDVDFGENYNKNYYDDCSIADLERMCNLPEGVGLFDDDR